jgi:hypothetical protein
MVGHSDRSAAHLDFLVKLQRLLNDGGFTATYKFALLMALADIAIERGSDDLQPLEIPTRDIGEKFIDYYWQQTVPYATLHGQVKNEVLRQNTRKNAKIVNELKNFRDKNGIQTLAALKKHPKYQTLLTSVTNTVGLYPLGRLQRIGNTKQEFIYSQTERGVCLTEVANSSLRKFHQLIQEMVRVRWIQFIKSIKDNELVLGQQDDLYAFLFESKRESLSRVGKGLRSLFNDRCFYCGHKLREKSDVDHFIPFSQYGRDIGQNFVPSHPQCNRSKSNWLAGERHLNNWLNHLSLNASDVSDIAESAGFISDPTAILAVAEWAYRQAFDANARAWIKHKEDELVSHRHLHLLSNAVNCPAVHKS